jgi:hypothetical protein
MSLVLQSSGGGQITIQEPTTASNFTQTLPAATGEVMVSGNMPAFSAFQSSGQTINASVTGKVTFTTETFDTNNNFASSTFTPTVAGYYQINACVSIGPVLTGYITIFKNGSEFNRGFQTSSASIVGFVVSSLIYCNGTTDYIEIYFSNQTVSNVNTNAASNLTWFNGSLVRAA